MPRGIRGTDQTMEQESAPLPEKESRSLAIVILGGIALVLAVFLVIALIVGDPTDHLEERQPEPSPSTTAP
jgi:hypothetical protein